MQNISLMGKPFAIRCPEDKAERLQQAVEHLAESMKIVQQSGNVCSFESQLVTAALNITDELLAIKSMPLTSTFSLDNRIENLRSKIEDVLT